MALIASESKIYKKIRSEIGEEMKQLLHVAKMQIGDTSRKQYDRYDKLLADFKRNTS